MGSQAEVDAAAVAHGAPELLGVIDRDARLVWCNRRWYEFAGRDDSQLLGDLWLADLHGEDLPLLRTLLQHAEPFVLDVRMRRHDGRERSMAMRGTPHEGDATIVSLVDTEGRRIAEALQHSMLPDAMPDIPGVSLHARYLPGGNEDIGGDWYDVVPLQGARYGVVIGDVAGHGVRAATVMGQLRHALRAFAADGVDPARVIARLNRFVFEQGPHDMSTLCYGVLDPAQGRIDLSTAAHMPPLLVRPDHSVELVGLPPAPPVGGSPMSRYATTTVHLGPGATLLLYTDGLIERRRETLDTGFERLLRVMRAAPRPLDAMCEHLVDRLLGTARPTDDVAILGLRFAGASRGHLRVRRPARTAELSPARRIVSAWLESAGFGGEDIGSIAVAMTEAATNAIEHAYGAAEGWFEVEGMVGDDGSVSLTVRDGGRWRPKARGGGGRGLVLIGRLMDEFEVRRQPLGTEIWMRRSRRGKETSDDDETSA